MKNKEVINSKGFSVLEVLIASFMFSAIAGGVIIFGTRSLESHMKSRSMQQALDNARFAIEDLNKKIRTSNNVTNNALYGAGAGENFPSGSQNIFVVDNVDGARYCYEFITANVPLCNAAANSLIVRKDIDGDLPDRCSDFDVADGCSLVVGNTIGGNNPIEVSGSFNIKETGSSGPRGMVTTVLQVRYNGASSNPNETDRVKFQSTVSIRDYQL